MRAHALVSAAVMAGSLAATADSADGQTLGTFRWQQQPYCNVITLTVVQDGAVYHLDGYDDQCGAARRASAAGVGFANPDGTIGFGLTIVTNDGIDAGGAPLHIDAALSLATISGTWRDSAGNAGAWTFVPGGGLGGTPRPIGTVGTLALAPGAVTSDKLAPSTFAGTGAAATVSRSDHEHDARYYTRAQVDGRLFSGLVGMGLVGSGGFLEFRTPGTAVTVTKFATGTYSLTVPGLNPGCATSRRLFAVVSATSSVYTAAPTSGSTTDCLSGNTSTVVEVRLGGILTDSYFTFILFVATGG